jgi:primosomal protein N'
MLNKYPLVILEVLVLQRFPYGKDSTFFYFAAKDHLRVQVGDVVKIPWRNREKNGVVVKIKRFIVDQEPGDCWKMPVGLIKNRNYFYSSLPTKPINLRTIKGILAKGYFSFNLLDKLKTAAKQYFVSWNHFANSVIDLPSARVKKGIQPAQFYLPLVGGYQAIFKNKIKEGNITPDEINSWIFASYGQQACLKTAIKRALTQKKQILVIVPEKTHLIAVAGKYSALAGSFGCASPILLGKFLPRTIARSGWDLTRQIDPYIFVGTRSAIFAPFANLGLIILEDGQDASHKQWDLSPLYDTRKLLELFYPAALKIYLSDTPRLEDFYDSPFYFFRQGHRMKIKHLTFANIGREKSEKLALPEETVSPHLLIRKINRGKLQKRIILVNTQIEKSLAREEMVISEYLKKQLLTALGKGKSALLVINHSGFANLIICQDCGYIFRCPNCGKALSQVSKTYLNCRFCGFKETAGISCPKCSGVKIVFRRPGIENIKESLLELKNEANFSILEAPKTQAGYSKVINFTRNIIQKKNPLVLLGFSGIISVGRVLKKELGLAAILDFDETLFYPDFRSEERAASRFYNLLAVAPRILIQTADPNQPFLREILNRPYSSLFSRWLEERTDFAFPPMVNIMRIDIPKADLANKIVNQLSGKNGIIEALNIPVSGATRKNKYGAAVLVKYKRGIDIAPVIDGLFPQFGNLRIDPNPEEL